MQNDKCRVWDYHRKSMALNADLTVVGLVFILLFVFYYLGIEIHNLSTVKERLNLAQRTVISMNKELEAKDSVIQKVQTENKSLKTEIKELEEVKRIQKEIVRVFNRGQN